MANLLDSSFWVALFLDFDASHQKAAQMFPKLKGKIYLPYCVANEVITVLAYKHSKKQADLFIAFIEGSSDIQIIENKLLEELAFYAGIDKRVSFTDAALVLLSKRLKVKLITSAQFPSVTPALQVPPARRSPYAKCVCPE